MHLIKIKRPTLGHMILHYERGKDKDGNPIKFKNQSIDLSRSHLNRNLAPRRDISQLDYINSLIDQYCQRKRKDMVCIVSVVVTLPQNVKPEHSDDFFEAAHKALTNMFIGGNEDFCVSSWIHRDETLSSGREHLHYSFCPIIYDKKKQRYKFCAKEVVNRNALQNLHPYVEKEVGKAFEKYGYTPQILTGVMSTRKNLPIEKYKEYANLRTAIAQSEKELYAIAQRHRSIEHKLRALELEYAPKREYLDSLEKIYSGNEVKENKNFFTGHTTVTLPAELWESQKILFSDYLAAKHMRIQTEKKIAEMQEYLADIDNTDFEEKITDLTEQIEQLEQRNKQLEYSLHQFDLALEFNPALKDELELTQQWMSRGISLDFTNIPTLNP